MYIQQVVNLYIKTIMGYKAAADAKGIRPAVYVGGGQVSLNGRLYSIDLAGDIHLYPNQIVYVALSQDGQRAVIIG